MSKMAIMNNQQNVISGSFRRNWSTRVLASLKSWNMRRKAIQELNAMPDSLLNDLGIARYQIKDVVNQSGSFSKLHTASSTSTAVVAPLSKAAA